MITSLLLVPIIGSLVLIAMNENTEESRTKMKQIAITTALINLIISIIM
jgi:NADH-ubiquinone oxidoreductase chain 4